MSSDFNGQLRASHDDVNEAVQEWLASRIKLRTAAWKVNVVRAGQDLEPAGASLVIQVAFQFKRGACSWLRSGRLLGLIVGIVLVRFARFAGEDEIEGDRCRWHDDDAGGFLELLDTATEGEVGSCDRHRRGTRNGNQVFAQIGHRNIGLERF